MVHISGPLVRSSPSTLTLKFNNYRLPRLGDKSIELNLHNNIQMNQVVYTDTVMIKTLLTYDSSVTTMGDEKRVIYLMMKTIHV